MKVLNIAYDDYANLAYDNSLALQAVGIDCQAVKRKKHPFGYEKEARVVTENALLSMCSDADIIQSFHSWDPGWDMLRKKKSIIWHTGTAYRLYPETCNKKFNDIVDMTITDQCEFMHLGAENIHYMATAIDTKALKESEILPIKPFTIGHFPSNETVKGTDKIVEMLSTLPYSYHALIDKEKVTHSENLKRIASCDIYIELFAPTQHGKEYGCFGVTAFEAAALGKIVVTQNTHKEVYREAYGECPFLIANTEIDFHNIMSHLLSMSENYIISQQIIARERLVKNHSFVATGERWKKLLEMSNVLA